MYSICFEGITGVGKSRQLKLLDKYLQSAGYTTKKVKAYPLEELLPLLWKESPIFRDLFPHARNEQIKEILRIAQLKGFQKVIENSKATFVLVDENVLSTYVYSEEKDIVYDMIDVFHNLMLVDTFDITFVLTAKLDTILKRAEQVKKNKFNFLRSEDINRIQKRFVESASLLAEEESIVFLNANYSAEDIHAKVVGEVERRLLCGTE